MTGSENMTNPDSKSTYQFSKKKSGGLNGGGSSSEQELKIDVVSPDDASSEIKAKSDVLKTLWEISKLIIFIKFHVD